MEEKFVAFANGLYARPVVLFDVDGNIVSPISGGVTVAAEFTRPADVLAYVANDVVANSTGAPLVLSFAGAVRAPGGSGYVVKALLETNQSAQVQRMRLHLFHTAPAAQNDNAPYSLVWANRTKRIGHIDFGALSTEGAGSDSSRSLNKDDRLQFTCQPGSTTIYGILQTLDGFVPASAQVFYPALSFDQN
jgi:hypothetical protein